MFDTDNLCPLALEVLEGEKHTHKILADLLEEQGHRGLAQWARSRKDTLRKRLDITLAVIPCTMALRLACDYTEHVLGPPRESYEEQNHMVRLSIERLRKWAIGTIHQEDVTRADAVRKDILLYRLRGDPSSPCLVELAQAAAHVIASTATEDRESVRSHHALEAGTSVRNVAKYARCAAHEETSESDPRRSRSWSHLTHQSTDELQRQIWHARHILEKIVIPDH